MSTITPYKGLEPFTRKDADYFFGREQLIEKIVNRIIHLTEQQPQPDTEAPLRFISIVGASGSGKSSLVMAGVMSALRERDQHWLCLNPIRPGYDPLAKLAQTLALYQPQKNAKSEDTLIKNLRDNTTSLQKLTESIAKPKNSKLILYIDQFEELFVTGIDKADQDLFIDRLESVARDLNKRVFVLITLRADFYPHLLEHNRLATLLEQQTITVPAMNIEQLRAVIEKPARLVGLEFEGNLVGDLLNDISRQREALPLLQFTLKKLYDRSNHRLLTTHSYEELGGVSGALDHYAEDIFQGNLPDQQSLTSDSQREMARHLFSKLIYINGSVDNATRRRASMSELQLTKPEDHQTMLETIEVFVKARLLIRDNQGLTRSIIEDPFTKTTDTLDRAMYHDTTLEISHEALIREWKSLRTWIEQHQDDLHVQQSVDDASKKWKQDAQPEKQLYSGQELKKALSWSTNNKPNALQMHFIQASQKRQKKRWIILTMSIISALVIVLVAMRLIIVSVSNYNISKAVSGTFVVNNTNDTGPGSLRYELSKVFDKGEIHFAAGLQGRITLSSNDLIFDKNVTIDGGPNIEISSDKNQHRIIIDAHKTVTLQNLIFTGSHIDSSSFITNQGNLTLSSCNIHNNITDNNGGGISNEGGGTLTLQNTTIRNNTASRNGGGVYTQDGVVNINNSSITDNMSSSGGGVYSVQGNVFINNQSKILRNHARAGDGGGIDAYHSFLIFTASTVEDNTTTTYGGGISIVGSQAIISTANIIKNTAGTDGGGISVVKDTANNNPSLLTINNTEIKSPANINAPYAVRDNSAHQDANILGVETSLGVETTPGETTYMKSDNKDHQQGNPPPKFMPETQLAKTNYLHTVDLTNFCQSQGYNYGTLSTDKDTSASANDIQVKCFSPIGNNSQLFTAQVACQQAFSTDKNVYDRLADYNDQSSLQCYRNIKLLGPIATEQNIQKYCQSALGQNLDNNTRLTAYDWKCVSSNGSPTSISITDACQIIYPNEQAFDQLVNYNRPDGWNCLAPA